MSIVEEIGVLTQLDDELNEHRLYPVTKDIVQTTKPILVYSYPGAIRLNELGGVSEQDSTTGAQLLEIPDTLNTTVAGVIAKSNGDETFSLTGTSTAADGIFLVGSSFASEDVVLSLKAGTYSVSGIPSSALFYLYKTAGSTSMTEILLSKDGTFTLEEDTNFCSVSLRWVSSGAVFSNNAVKLMINAGSTALPWEPYTGGQPSPNPEYPQTIKPVEGKNLLDCRGLVEQTDKDVKFTPIKDNNGNLLYAEVNGTNTSATLASYYKLGEISKPGNYIFNGCPSGGATDTYRVMVESANKVFTTVNDIGNGVAFTVSNGDTVTITIRIGMGYTATHLRFYPMIRPASIADDTYVPYGLLRFWGHWKNFLNPTLGTTSKNNITCTNNGNGTYTLDGTAQYATTFVLQSDIVVNGLYKLIGCPKNGSTTTYFLQLNSADAALTDVGDGISEQINGIFELRISIKQGVTCNNVVFKPMLTTDLTATYDTYEPYTSQSIILSKPIKLNGVGTAQDKIVRKDGVWKIERNFAETVLNGSVTPTSISVGNNGGTVIGYKYTDIGMGAVNKNRSKNRLCDRLQLPDSYTPNSYKDCNINHWGFNSGSSNDEYFIYCIDEEFTTATEVQEWEKEHPIIVVFDLAQTTYEDLPTADQIALNSLVSYDGITYLHCDSEVQPTWDLEYGTNRVGVLSLENSNLHEDMRIYTDTSIAEVSDTVDARMDAMEGVVKFNIATSDWVASGDSTHPYSVTKTNAKYTKKSMPVWCLAGTGSETVTDGSGNMTTINDIWTDADDTANDAITKCVCGNGTITFYATEEITTAVKILVKGV